MREIEIEITETLSRIVSVKASDYSEALGIVKDMYNNEEIVLDSGDYVDTDFKLWGEDNES